MPGQPRVLSVVGLTLVGLFWVRPARAQTTERASVATVGIQANGNSADSAISADGRFVSFRSSATDLVPGDTNTFDDIFVRDLLTRRTTRVSVGPDGRELHLSAQDQAKPFNGDVDSLAKTEAAAVCLNHAAPRFFVMERQDRPILRGEIRRSAHVADETALARSGERTGQKKAK